ncbi:MAG: hypothetical protein OHK0046_52110 [Anaerolineae bacterium]
MTNMYVIQHLDNLRDVQALRHDALNVFTSADLPYRPGGTALSLGELCKEMGDTQLSYLNSLKTLTHDYTTQHPDTTLTSDLPKLTEWFKAMDAEMNALVEGMNDDEIQRIVDRGYGFMLPVGAQMHVYKEALMLFLGKISIYMRVMNKPLPEKFGMWIG